MQSDPQIEQTWLEMLKAVEGSREPLIRILEKGYYAVVLLTSPSENGVSATQADFERLKPHIPNLDGTRAVYLNSAARFGLPRIESATSWAGPLAAGVENGSVRAFAVVEVDLFKRQLAQKLTAGGCRVEEGEQCLCIERGRFTEQVNLPNSIVRMVLSRSRVSCAIRAVARELQGQFALTTDFFRCFQRRFRGYDPSVLGHYFVANPGESCLVMGWDYWEIRGKGRREASRVFEQASDEMEELLKSLSDEQNSKKFAGVCELFPR